MKKKYSLKSKIKFNKILNKGKKINTPYFLLSSFDSDEFKIGISIPKKLGNAVFRNYNKRVIKNIIPSIDFYKLIKKEIVFIAKEKFIDLSIEEKRNFLNDAFLKLK